MNYDAVLFDLDGVIADTARFHFKAWKMIAEQYNIELEDEFEENLKGIDRANSLKLILQYGNVEVSNNDFEQLLVTKNNYYLQLIQTLTPSDALPGIAKLFADLQADGIKIVIASASKNAPFILDKLQLTKYVDGIANPEHVAAGKPAPDIFLEAARIAEVAPNKCLGIEDAQAGVQAIKAANMVAVAIGDLPDADYKLDNTAELTYHFLKTIK